jgi:hypothetical protein
MSFAETDMKRKPDASMIHTKMIHLKMMHLNRSNPGHG